MPILFPIIDSPREKVLLKSVPSIEYEPQQWHRVPPFNAVSFRKEERVGKIDISGGPLKLSEWLGLAWLGLACLGRCLLSRKIC